LVDFMVFIVAHPVTCSECGTVIDPQDWFSLGEFKESLDRTRQRVDEGRPALCLTCADLDDLVFLPAGDVALTRRAHKYSTLAALVLEWNKRRRRYERRGLLVEMAGLEQAEQECLADADVRARRRERETVRREAQDQQYIEQFAGQIRRLFPACPPEQEQLIAAHACEKYSGRVGRSAAAKELSEKAVRLAVIAHVRHTRTDYDARLAAGQDRQEARAEITGQIERVLKEWGSSSTRL
jgi:hypothetical protein